MSRYDSIKALGITDAHYKKLEELVELGEFPSVSDAIRTAIGELIKNRTEKLEARSKLPEPYGKMDE